MLLTIYPSFITVLVVLLIVLVLIPTSPIILSYLIRLVSLKASILTPIGIIIYITSYYLSLLIFYTAIYSFLKPIIPPLLLST